MIPGAVMASRSGNAPTRLRGSTWMNFRFLGLDVTSSGVMRFTPGFSLMIPVVSTSFSSRDVLNESLAIPIFAPLGSASTEACFLETKTSALVCSQGPYFTSLLRGLLATYDAR